MERVQKVYPDCVNASNPFHQCGDHCLHRPQNPNFKISRSKSPVGNGGRVNIDRYCVNASNPFHTCGDHCSKKTVNAKKLNGTGKFVINGARAREEGRNVNPDCANASNPFHQCTDYCTKRVTDAESIRTGIIDSMVAKNGKLSNGIGRKEARNVNPSCANASNPFHQCTEYCSQRTSAAKRYKIQLMCLPGDSIWKEAPLS